MDNILSIKGGRTKSRIIQTTYTRYRGKNSQQEIMNLTNDAGDKDDSRPNAELHTSSLGSIFVGWK
jgi:hypothetical protein